MTVLDSTAPDAIPNRRRFSDDNTQSRTLAPTWVLARPPHNTVARRRVVRARIGHETIPLFIDPRPIETSAGAYLAAVALILLIATFAGAIAHFVVAGPFPMLVSGIALLGIAAVALYAKHITRLTGHAGRS